MDNMPHSAYTQKVELLFGNGFNDKEVQSVLTALDDCNAFYDIASDKLGKVKGANGAQITVTCKYYKYIGISIVAECYTKKGKPYKLRTCLFYEDDCLNSFYKASFQLPQTHPLMPKARPF
jgi:hypothetical protein